MALGGKQGGSTAKTALTDIAVLQHHRGCWTGQLPPRHDAPHTSSIALRHPPPRKEGCRKPVLGVWLHPPGAASLCTAHPFPQRNEFTLLVRRSTSLSFLPNQITLLSPLASQYFRSKTHCIVISKRLYSGYGSGGTAAHTDEKQCVWWLIFKQSRDFFIQLYKLLVIKEPLRNFQHPMPESGKQ